jgi:hypothetical protein
VALHVPLQQALFMEHSTTFIARQLQRLEVRLIPVFLQIRIGRENEITLVKGAPDFAANWHRVQIDVLLQEFGTFEVLNVELVTLRTNRMRLC